MVDTAGGSWWRRVWRTRTPRREAVCTFCDRPPSEVAKLIAGPDVYICDACVGRAERGLFARAAARVRCSFCGKDARRVVGTAAAAVCGECLAACREILDGRDGAGA
jgi:ATP-dependent protease Clp ATPase subunit